MRTAMHILFRSTLARCERAATAVEYGLILALIVLAIMGALRTFAGKSVLMWSNIATQVTSQ
jgi:pilus assembly protein Flp/PilA